MYSYYMPVPAWYMYHCMFMYIQTHRTCCYRLTKGGGACSYSPQLCTYYVLHTLLKSSSIDTCTVVELAFSLLSSDWRAVSCKLAESNCSSMESLCVVIWASCCFPMDTSPSSSPSYICQRKSLLNQPRQNG